MKTRWLVVLLLAVAAPSHPMAAQDFRFSPDQPVLSAERFGSEFARPLPLPAVPSGYETEEGSADRVCVDVDRESVTVRSGEFIIGGRLSRLAAGELQKIWWKPLDSSQEMELRIAVHSLDGSEDRVEFQISPPTWPHTNDRPPQPIVEEAFFPGGALFPDPGRWIAVATSGRNWGCFIFHIPDSTPGVE